MTHLHFIMMGDDWEMGHVLCSAMAERLMLLSLTWANLGHHCVLQDEGRTSLHDFDTKASTLYLVSMSTFWILTVATGGSHLHELLWHEQCAPEFC